MRLCACMCECMSACGVNALPRQQGYLKECPFPSPKAQTLSVPKSGHQGHLYDHETRKSLTGTARKMGF